jgi:polyhydroxybutyrate depolymerase
MKLICTIAVIIVVTVVKAQGVQQKSSLVVDNITRTFIIYTPSAAAPAQKLPILISLHGRMGTGEQMIGFADFRPLADKEKFIIVSPDGVDRSWNAGGNTPANRKGINDVSFIDQLIIYVVKTYNGDAQRVYVTGMSNGGFLSSRLACQLNNRIAAVAVVAASMGKNMGFQPEKPMPVIYIQGTKDPLVPFDGGIMSRGSKMEIYGHEEILKLWVDADHCSDIPVITNLPVVENDGTSVTKEEYTNAETGVKVIGYTINNGGHAWPDERQYLPKAIVGKMSHNLEACKLIWQFFKGYKLPGS